MKKNEASDLDASDLASANLTNIDLRRLQAFVLAARTQSFGTAAQSLNVVPSAISHGIRSLEAELGCSLFLRRGPKVTLTRAGQQLIPLVNDVLRRIHELRDTAQSIESQGDTLRLAVPELLCSRLLPAILPDFQECMPEVALTIVPITSQQQVRSGLGAGRLDLVFSLPGDLPEGLQKRNLFEETLVCCVSPGHPLLKTREIQLRDLQPYTVLTSDSGAHRQLLDAFASQAAPVPAETSELPSIEGLQAIALVSNSVAVMPSWVVQTGPDATKYLQPLRWRVPGMKRTWAAYSWKKDPLPWAAEVLIGLIELRAQEIHDRMKVAINKAA